MDENTERLRDLLGAIAEDGITSVVESDDFHSLMINTASHFVSESAAPLIGSIFGAIAPRANGIYLSYKQHRFERNMKALFKKLSDRMDILESNYQGLSETVKKQYNECYVELLLDGVIEERQEEKIEMYANGFISLMTNDANENVMQLFFDTLTELTVLDIDTLRMYSSSFDFDWHQIEQKYGIDSSRLGLVKEKLVRYGLLYRKNDQIRDENSDEIVEYLKKKDADSKKTKPQGVRFPSSIHKIGISESYKITPLGKSFLKNISVDPS